MCSSTASGSRIRLATGQDADAIARIHTASWQAGYRGVMPSELLDGLRWQDRAERWRTILANQRPGESTLIVALDDRDVGFCSVGPTREDHPALTDTFELYAIYLLPEAWGTDLGTALLTASLERVPAQAPAVTLWVLADNPRARGFYERHGFALDGATKSEDFGGRALEEVRYRLPRHA